MGYDSGGSSQRIAVVVIVVVVAATLGISSVFMPQPENGPSLTTTPVTLPEIWQEDHAPIRITNDSELHEKAISEEWRGNGTFEYPYVIEDYYIIADRWCVFIRNVSLNIVIKDCFFHGDKQLYSKGVYVESASNVFVYECFFNQIDEGVTFFFVEHSNVSSCTFLEVNTGVNATLSAHVGFYDCVMAGGSGDWYYDDFKVSCPRGAVGAFIVGSNDTVTCSLNLTNYEWGVLAQFSNNCSISHSALWHNVQGIQIDYQCTNWMIQQNKVVHNERVGICIGEKCYVIRSWLNSIGWNNETNALDNGSENYWDDGKEIGNSWSDYNGSGSYLVPGAAESVDRYPTLLLP
ncbi:MAG: right-handed parallel beta-helix repeat-containing protein [Candidatus Thorarchaeota archaeon]|nr:MAG: right-handed parallel beta-helix repeat-containing protein [Candidatus Thorarchaeota archaeon]